MIKIQFTLLLYLMFCFQTNAQSTFGKIFRSENPFTVYNGSHAAFLQTADSALLLIYNVNDTTPGTNLCLVKLTNDGQVIWKKYLPLTTDMEKITDAVQMPDGTINILCTYDISNLIYDEEVYFVKIDLDGNLLNTDFQTSTGICCWDIADGRLNLNLKNQLLYTHQSFGISFSNGVVQLADTNYNYLSGATDVNTLYHAAVFQDADSSYLSFGHEPSTPQKRAALFKRNKQFTFQWQKLFRHSSTAPNKLTIADDAINVDSTYVLLMHFEDTVALNNIYIVKTNLNGDSLTSAKILSTSLPFGIYSLGTNGYIMAASNVSNNNYANLELTRLDTAFQVLASRNYRFKNFNERCFSFKPAYDGTFLVAASADSVFNRNIHILKIKPDLCVDPLPSFSINYNTGFGPGVPGIIINNTSDYGIADSLNTLAVIYFGDGDSADFFVDSLSHIYPGQGTYTVTVVITTPCGTQSHSQLVVVPCTGQPPAFTYTTNLLTISTGYNFAGSFYNWDFGDGGTANTQTATHTYGSSGTYYVCLNTTNSCGNIQICDSVTVVCTAPVIPFLPVAKACIGNTISIDAGSPGSSYLWSNGLTTQVAGFSTAGVYTVTVTNNCGVSATASVDVQFNALPLVDIGADSIICINDLLILSNYYTGNNNTYQWFRDDVFQSSGTNYYFSSSNTGLFHFTLVADNDGCVDSTSRSISVNPGLFCDTVSYCLPTYNTGTTQGDYIKRVSIGTLNNITGGTGEPGYMDYTGLTTALNAGQSVTLQLDFNEVNPMYYKVWIDYNQDGIFTNTEVLSSNAVNPGLTTVFTSISANAYGGPTRMRVRCADSPTSNMDPCANYNYGQTEDYTLLINNGTGAPVVNFTADTTHIYINGVVNFTDLSYNNPNAWEWTFTGAATNTSSVKNPSGIVYPTPGCFPVTLKAYNASGFNTKTDTCYIFVDLSLSQAEPNMKDHFDVLPNPFNKLFILQYNISENATMEITDVIGRNILREELDFNSPSKEITLSPFHPGIFFLKIWNKGNILFKSAMIGFE